MLPGSTSIANTKVATADAKMSRPLVNNWRINHKHWTLVGSHYHKTDPLGSKLENKLFP